MKKVAVTTYCTWSSYGSIMQSLALKKVIKKLGLDSYILLDYPAPSNQYEQIIPFPKSVKSLIIWLYKKVISKKTKHRYKNSNEFIKRNLDVCYYNDYETVVKQQPKADFYLAGSDQIWHPALCKPLFFLDFLPNETKRLSYAASMGITTVSNEKESEFAGLISKMNCISVREKEMAQVIQKYTDKSVSVNIDPTFLVDGEEWTKYAEEYPLKKPYILVYTIYWDKALNNKLKKLHKETGHDIVNLTTDFVRIYANKKVLDASPGQFLWLVKNAQAVVTSSFHGLAFSIIFGKKFSAVINPNSPSRMNGLLERLGIVNSDIDSVMDFDLSKYKDIRLKIKEEQTKSEEYLKGILNE